MPHSWITAGVSIVYGKECNMTRVLPGGGAVEVTVNWTIAENELISLKEFMEATDTVYSASHKPGSVTLALEVYIVVLGVLSWYLTL